MTKKEEYFDAVLEAFNNKDYNKLSKLINKFSNSIESDELSLIYYFRGAVSHNRGDYKKALKDYNKALELDDNLALAYNNRGLIYYYREDYKKALDDYNKALELDNNLALAYNNRGLIYYYREDYDKAINDFKEIYKDNPFFHLINLLLRDKKYKDIHDIENLSIKYANYDSYFSSVVKDVKNKELCKIWGYQYVLLDLLSVKNYNIKEFSHYREKHIFEKLVNSEENNNAYLRLASISKVNDPKEGEILKDLLSVNIKNDISVEEKNKDYLVLQTSFIRYTNSLTMFRLYGKEEEKEGTGICFVFNESFFDVNNLTSTSPFQYLGASTSQAGNHIDCKNIKKSNVNDKDSPLIYSKIYPSIKQKEKLPLYFILYYDSEKNELIYNPTNSVYKNKVINLANLCNKELKYDIYNKNITNNIKFILKKIFTILEKLKSDELKIAYKLLINIRYLIKHSAFFEEQELRLIKLVKNDDIDILFDKNINRLYSNYEVSIFDKDYLKKLIIGPKVKEASSLKETYQYLIMKNSNNKNIDIEISDLPLN